MSEILTYEDFTKEVDLILRDLTGMGHEDMPDFMWMSCFEDDISPQESIAEFVANNRDDMEWMEELL